MNKFSAARAFLWPWTNVFAVERFCGAETSFSVGRRGEEFDLETLEDEKKKRRKTRVDIYLRFDLSASLLM